MAKIIVKVAKTENGYCATLEEVTGFVVAVTGGLAALRSELKESLDFYVECAKADGEAYPSALDEKYEFNFDFDVESLLYFYQGIFSRSALSRITGINEKQLSHYACGISKPRERQKEKIVHALHSLGEELVSLSV